MGLLVFEICNNQLYKIPLWVCIFLEPRSWIVRSSSDFSSEETDWLPACLHRKVSGEESLVSNDRRKGVLSRSHGFQWCNALIYCTLYAFVYSKSFWWSWFWKVSLLHRGWRRSSTKSSCGEEFGRTSTAGICRHCVLRSLLGLF